VAVIGGVEGDKMRNVATLDWLIVIFEESYTALLT
jgi:hypothetical protein